MSDAPPTAVALPADGKRTIRRRRVFALVAVVAIASSLLGYREYERRSLVQEIPPLDLSSAYPAVRRAIEQSRESVVNNPRSGQNWGQLGLVLRAHEFGPQAEQCLRIAERIEPAEFRWPYILGVSLSVVDPEAAITAFRRAQACRPAEPLPRHRITELLFDRGELDAAEQELQVLSVRNPEDARTLLNQARLALMRGNPRQGAELATAATKQAPASRLAHELLLQACHLCSDADCIRRETTALAQLPPKDAGWEDPYVAQVLQMRQDPTWLATMARDLLAEGQVDSAIEILEELVSQDPADPRWPAELARIHLRKRDLASAERVVAAALARHPESAELWRQQGAIYFFRKELSEAATAFRRSVEIQPDEGEVWFNLGQVLSQLKDSKAAIEAFRQALRCHPDLKAAQDRLEELLRDTKDAPESKPSPSSDRP